MAHDPILTAYAEEYGDWRAYGWTVERYGRAWMLRDLTILEAYARIASDARAYAANGLDVRTGLLAPRPALVRTMIRPRC